MHCLSIKVKKIAFHHRETFVYSLKYAQPIGLIHKIRWPLLIPHRTIVTAAETHQV